MERGLRSDDFDSGYDPDRDANCDWFVVVCTVYIVLGILALLGIIGLGTIVLGQFVSLP